MYAMLNIRVEPYVRSLTLDRYVCLSRRPQYARTIITFVLWIEIRVQSTIWRNKTHSNVTVVSVVWRVAPVNDFLGVSSLIPHHCSSFRFLKLPRLELLSSLLHDQLDQAGIIGSPIHTKAWQCQHYVNMPPSILFPRHTSQLTVLKPLKTQNFYRV